MTPTRETQIQSELYRLGYLTGDKAKVIDGNFGPKSKAALDKAQKDGYSFNDQTGRLIKKDDARSALLWTGNTDNFETAFSDQAEGNPILTSGVYSPEYKEHIVKRRGTLKGNKIAQLQEQLFSIGAFGDMDYDKVVDGKMGRFTRSAIERARQLGWDYNANDGTLTRKQRMSVLDQITSSHPIVSRLLLNGNPYGYVNTEVAKEKGVRAGVASKMKENITGSEIGALIEQFRQLDLNDPKQKKIAQQLASRITELSPEYGPNFQKGLERAQYMYRIRHDKSLLHLGRPQEFDTLMLNPDYKTRSGESVYVLRDPAKRKEVQNYMRQYVKNNNYIRKDNTDDNTITSLLSDNNDRLFEETKALERRQLGGYTLRTGKDGYQYRLYQLNSDPYAQFGNFTIITDADGSNPRYYDIWDFGIGNFSTNDLPGMHQVRTGDIF